jgi:hypothetical protein
LSSKDFWMTPDTLSWFWTAEIKRRGYAEVAGWRSGTPRDRVEALTTDGKVLRIGTGPGGVVEIADITDEVNATVAL